MVEGVENGGSEAVGGVRTGLARAACRSVLYHYNMPIYFNISKYSTVQN